MQPELPPDFGLYDELEQRGGRWRWGLVGLGLGLFVAGGLFFGLIFLDNWKLLNARRPSAPVIVAVPGLGEVKLPDPPVLNLPQPRTAERPTEAGNPALPLPSLPDWTGGRVNVLLLGIDHRPDEPMDGSRSDTVMFVTVDPATKSVVMVSLPRDLWVSIPGYGEQRLNVAHSLGGPSLVMRTVATNFNLKVDHYARIDFRGFEQIVDTLGGIFVDVERPIKDDEYPTEDYGVMRIYIPPGPQLMDGRTTLQYARSRHSENDFARARRQQRVLMAMRERAVQANVIFKAPELLPLAQKTVSTDFGPLDLAKLAKLASDIDRERIVNLVIDTDFASPYTTADGADVLIPNRVAIGRALDQALARAAAAPPSTPTAAPAATAPPETRAVPAASGPPVATKIEVLNGTSRPGLAAATSEWLRGKGYQITRVDSADRDNYAESHLVPQPGREAAASALAASLGLPATAVQSPAVVVNGPDIRLVLGQNYQLPGR